MRKNVIPAEEQYKYMVPEWPEGFNKENARVLLHACCAPCSGAIVECLLHNGVKPVVFFSNSNIYPLEEYNIRKEELKRFLKVQNVEYVEDEYDHQEWQKTIKGLEHEPERGSRCSACFLFRLGRAARYAKENGFNILTTTLASSRWKVLPQINDAGRKAVDLYPEVTFWEQNWRKGGLQLRRGELIKINNFYNQLFCGCEYSNPNL